MTPWAWIVSVGLLVLSLVAMWRMWESPSRWLTSAMAIAAGVLIYVPAGTLIGRDPSAALLAVLAGLKAWESREDADERTLHLIGLFLIAVLYLFRSDLWTLIAGVAAIAFFLFGLLRAQPASPSAEIARIWLVRLSLRALPLAVLLFFIVPRLQHSGWWDIGVNGKTGFHERLDPTTIDEIEEDTTPVLWATSTEGVFRDPIYWRGAILENADGFIWTPGPHARREGGVLPPQRPNGARISWILEIQSGRWIFAPEGSSNLAEIDAPSARQILGSVENGVWRWAVAPVARTRLGADLKIESARPGEFDARLLAVSSVGDAFKAWVKDVSTSSSRIDRVRALVEKFRGAGFVYTRRPGRLNNLEEFLGARKGFCEHYASATALILRGAGVPSRVVVGYLGGEWNPVGHFQVVTRADAHAWVEWLDEKNFWRTLDVTAVIPPADPRFDRRLRTPLTDTSNASWWDRLRWRIEAVNYDVAILLLNFDLDSQRQLWNRVLKFRSWATVGAVLFLLSLLWGLRWRSWNFSARAERREIRAYKSWFERGVRKGWPLSANLGPIENLKLAQIVAPDEAVRSEKIVGDYIRSRFGSLA